MSVVDDESVAKRAKLEKFTVYYWGMYGRAGSTLRMLLESGADFEHKFDYPSLASVCSAFGGDSISMAPPVVVHGDMQISQSTACAMYVGKQCGFPAPDDCLGSCYLNCIVDVFENGIGKNNTDGADLKVYLDGDGKGPSRFAKFAGSVEKQIKGPFYFGEEKSYVDFFLGHIHSYYTATTLAKFEKATGKDIFAPFPKIKAVCKVIQELPSFVNAQAKEGALNLAKPEYTIKDEVIAAYKAA